MNKARTYGCSGVDSLGAEPGTEAVPADPNRNKMRAEFFLKSESAY